MTEDLADTSPMTKHLFLFLVITMLFCGCKKDTIEIPRLPAVKFLKSKTTGYTTSTYHYSADGRLESTVTSLNDPHHTPASMADMAGTETYTYNSAGRMIRSASPNYTNTYTYDANNLILRHVRMAKSGEMDTVSFVHHKDTTVGTWGETKYIYINKRLEYYSLVYHYSFNAHPMTMTLVNRFYYNNWHDLSSGWLLNSYDAYTVADFSSPRPHACNTFVIEKKNFFSLNF